MSANKKISGLIGSSAAYWLSKESSSALVLTPPLMPLKEFAEALRQFRPEAEVLEFPHFERVFEVARPQLDRQLHRLRTQKKLLEKPKEFFLLTNPIALCQRVVDPMALKSLFFPVKKGAWIERSNLRYFLRSSGYLEDSTSNDRALFSIRGHLIDIFDPTEDQPYRIEFFGDEVVSIRKFDPQTQRSLEEIEECELSPCREFSLRQDTKEEVFKNLKKLTDSKGVPPTEREEMFWKLENQREFINTRLLLPALGVPLTPLTDYFQRDLSFVFLNKPEAVSQVEEIWQQELAAQDTDIKLSYPASDLQTSVETWTENFVGIEIEEKIQASSEIVECVSHQDFRSRLVRSKGFAPLVDEVKRLRTEAIGISIFIEDPRRQEAVQDALGEECLGIEFQRKSGSFTGFQSKSLRQAIFTNKDIFGVSRKRAVGRSRISAEDFLREFSDLKEGDFIIHEEHGLGKYLGLQTLSVAGATSEFAQIEYADGDKLYLPIYRLDQLSRYVKGDGYASPRLDKLGSKQFIKKKQRAKEDILRIAHELIEIAAKRRLVKMNRETFDENDYQRFGDDFPYELTPDQESAVKEIERDLTQSHPMDRLICGDVGFGKTEVALRAIMLRLSQAAQVAVLAPTTLLVEQHYQNFRKRFEKYGFRIERLSRFVSRSEQSQITKDLKEGKVDLVVGTHRLLQKDIQFKELGLLVVDEEQRFGVKHKEKIKDLKASLDVLTLSATPIPRTLQMSIAGIKELSLIVTPPESRESVQTSVGLFDEKLIREAVLRELKREGQVFFVHNRVKSIEKVTENLRKLIPEAKIEFAHGQMKETDLEEKMLNFMNRKFDILVATSIIENGIDISNANTLIVDHSEHFGLSDLYQIRGRVGRSDRKAYAYFLLREETALTEEASKRLQVIQNCSELGSGFRVATHDLEIRGSGNLLGEEQSGVIAEIGLELYNQMLLENLEEMKANPSPKESLPELNFSLNAYIPDHYIPDPSLRVGTYRRLNRLSTTKELLEFESELLDRFGLYPQEVEDLCLLTQTRILAHRLKAESLECGLTKMLIAFRPETPLDATKILKNFQDKLSFDTRGRLVIPIEAAPKQDQTAEKAALLYMIQMLKELGKLAQISLD